MNSKAIAAIMALAMVAVGFAVTAVDSDVDGETTIDRVTVAVGESKDTGSMVVNEGNYASYSYELKWTININGTKQDLGTITQERSTTTQTPYYYNGSTFSSKAGESDLASIQLVMDSTVGVYHLNIIGQDKAGEFGYTVEAALKVWVGTDVDTAKDFGVFTTFNGTVVVTDTDNTIDVNIEEGKTFKVGTYTMASIKSSVTIANYDWYATNLPDGLTMGYDGKISGIPTVKNIDGDGDDNTTDKQRTYTFQVYASDKKDGTILYDADVTITIQAQDEPSEMNFTYEVTVGNKAAKTDSTYIASVNDTVTLTVKSAGADGGSSPLQGVSVTIIGDSGDDPETTDENGQIKLPTTGTGAYIVTMTYDGQTQSFTVYVVGQATDIEASIVIEGA